MLEISELKLNIHEDESLLKTLIAKKLKTNNFKYEIFHKSLDARKEPIFVYSCLVEITNENKYLKLKNVSKYIKPDLSVKQLNLDLHPLIVGYGPSGIFCALRLLEAGLKPIVFEKGKRISEREKDVENFFNNGIFNESSNVAYGEGGAGTFSDAKLTTRIKDPFVSYILDAFIKFGANKEIKYEAHAHIGSDEIRKIITRITDYLIENGVEFHFEEELKELILDDNHNLIGIKTNQNSYYSNYCFLGVGHSNEDLIANLINQDVYIEKKDFTIGFRVEHPQTLIDENQYHGLKDPLLKPSEYFLRYTKEKGAFSFCMCPGGYVIPSNHKAHSIATNGMSYSKRDAKYANSAILIQVNKDDFSDPLSAFKYITSLEEKAYAISSSYKAPAQNISDYMDGTLSPLKHEPSYPLGTVLYDINNFFSVKDNEIIHDAFKYFDSKINGFIKEGIIIAPETRSSCPVRIKRDLNLESINTKGLYPMGEGSGYGGGIMSCSLDGIRCANAFIISVKVHK